MLGFKTCVLICAFATVAVLAVDDKLQWSYQDMQETITEFYSGCGSKKFCLGPDSGCVDDLECSYFVSISVSFNESFAQFQITRKGLGYVAVGLSYNDQMTDANMVACVQAKNKESSTAGIFSVWADGQGKFTDVKKAESYTYLSNYESRFFNDNLICQFELSLNSTRKERVFDLSKKDGKLQIFLAMGNITLSSNSKNPIFHRNANATVTKAFVLPGGDDDDQPGNSSTTSAVLQGIFVLVPSLATMMLLR